MILRGFASETFLSMRQMDPNEAAAIVLFCWPQVHNDTGNLVFLEKCTHVLGKMHARPDCVVFVTNSFQCKLPFYVNFVTAWFCCFSHLLVNPKERRVVVVESVFCPTIFRDTLARVLFDHYEVRCDSLERVLNDINYLV